MWAGRLRHQLQFQERSVIRDEIGGISETWSNKAGGLVWGSITGISATERMQGDAQLAEATHKIVIRGGLAVKHTDRVQFGSRVFGVVSATDVDERGEAMEVIVKEIKVG